MTPQIGRLRGSSTIDDVSPNSAKLSRTSGSALIGTSNRLHSSSSQRSFPMSYSKVRLALVVGGEHFAARESIHEISVNCADQGAAIDQPLPNVRLFADEPFQLG